jgi:hypothetical protein
MLLVWVPVDVLEELPVALLVVPSSEVVVSRLASCHSTGAASRVVSFKKLATSRGLMLKSVVLTRNMYRLGLLVTPTRPATNKATMLAPVSMNGRATQINLPTPIVMFCCCCYYVGIKGDDVMPLNEWRG